MSEARASWNEQIRRVAEGMQNAEPGFTAAVCVDDDPEKIGRFRKALTELDYIEIEWEGKGPTEGVYFFKVKRKPDVCKHERLNEEGICRSCGADCRGVG